MKTNRTDTIRAAKGAENEPRSCVGRSLARFAMLTLAGFALLLCVLASELMWLPSGLEGPGRAVYRAAFTVTLPCRVVALVVAPRRNHHYPVTHFIIACMGTPFLYWGLYRLARRTRGRGNPRSALPQVSSLKPQTPLPTNVSRRVFLARSAGGTAVVAGVSLGAYASYIEPERLLVRRYELPIADLPPEFEGLRITHVSDTHYGPYTAAGSIEDVVRAANGLEGDLVVFTGDHVHFTPKSVPRGIALLADFESRLGSVAVMGNHEHWEGEDGSRAAFARVAIPLLDNARLFLTPDGLRDTPVSGPCLCLAGVGDLWTDEVAFDRALRGVPETMPRLLLSHNPDAAELVPEDARVDLMLSGHTHGGQVVLPLIGPPVSVSRCGRKYLGGLCQGPYCRVLVSRGTGLAGVPFRLGVPPEISEITLTRATEKT